MYVVHDPEYMRMKYGDNGEKGEKLPYEWKAIEVSPDYDLEVAFLRAKSALSRSASNMVKRIQDGEKPVNLVREGRNVFAVNAVMNLVKTNDYTRLQDEFKRKCEDYDALELKFERLLDAIENAGFSVVVNTDTNLPFLAREPQKGFDDRLHTLDYDPFKGNNSVNESVELAEAKVMIRRIHNGDFVDVE